MTASHRNGRTVIADILARHGRLVLMANKAVVIIAQAYVQYPSNCPHRAADMTTISMQVQRKGPQGLPRGTHRSRLKVSHPCYAEHATRLAPETGLFI